MATNGVDAPLRTSDVTQAVKIRMGTEGMAAEPPTTVMQNFDAIVEKYGDKPALHNKIDGAWNTRTWKEYRAQVDAFAKSLLSLGFNRFDIVNIIGFNSPEWFFANYGSIAAGGVAAGIYATNNPEACEYIASHSKAKVIVCDGLKQLEKFYGISANLSDLKALVMYGTDELPADIKSKVSVPVYTFEDFQKLGSSIDDSQLKQRSESWQPGETCTLIYTSGTTGPPKAVMITNDNISFTVKTTLKQSRRGYLNNDDVMISYLPLSHIAAQVLDMHQALQTGCQVYFASPDALKGSLGATLKDVRPTLFFGVPRVWEKIYEKMQEVSRSTTGIKKALSTWAKKTATKHWEAQEFGSKTGSPMFYGLAKKLLQKAHVALGFDRCNGFYVGAAPTELKILKYFFSIDVPIMDLFGQSECTGPYTIGHVDAFRFGCVGRPLLGTEGKIAEGTGELCYRGRHIFAGYMNNEEKTIETIDDEGWLHSGDVGEFDQYDRDDVIKPSGFLKITGRIKELIITAGGENVPPVLIEDELKDAMPAISNAMVIGDKRKYLTVLVTLTVEVTDEGDPTNTLTGMSLVVAEEIGSTATTVAEARDDPKWQAYFDEGLKKANKKAASNAQRVQKWTLLDGDFSERGTELTPTLKLKRSVAAKKYTDAIEAMYA